MENETLNQIRQLKKKRNIKNTKGNNFIINYSQSIIRQIIAKLQDPLFMLYERKMSLEVFQKS